MLKRVDRLFFFFTGQIIEPMDGPAFIGKNSGDYDNVYIATGDSGHGITHGAIAAMILSELIDSGAHPWSSLYSPARFNWHGLPQFLKENFNTGIQYRDWISTSDSKDLEDMLPGEGRVISEGLSREAVLRLEDGSFQRLSTSVPAYEGHCALEWRWKKHGTVLVMVRDLINWGEVLNGPALSGMSPEEKIRVRIHAS